jgi:hypothetical protein
VNGYGINKQGHAYGKEQHYVKEKTMEKFNLLYRMLVLRTLKFLYQLYAKLSRKKFDCLTLRGIRGGLYVNSDMTVSCNCQDVDGSGQLCTLKEVSFEDILGGKQATTFRKRLSDGILPIERCAVCPDMRMVKKVRDPDQYSLPNRFAIENTSLCPLKCVSCPRKKLAQIRKGGRSMSLADIETLAQALKKINAVECNFVNLGEPFLSKNVQKELEIIRQYNPGIKILTSTSCMVLDNDEKREAALLTDHIVVSIFGTSTEMCNKYQRGLDFNKSFQNMRSLISFRESRGMTKPYILWHYVVFNWNDKVEYIEKAIELSREIGVDEIVFTFSRTPVYGISWRFLLGLPPFNGVLRKQSEWRYRRIRRNAAP